MINQIKEFKKIFNHPPDFFIRAPGRVNLSGSHVDYFGGKTVCVASDNLIMSALIRVRKDSQIRFYSRDLNNEVKVLKPVKKRTSFQPLEYIQGAREIYTKHSGSSNIKGFDIYVFSSIPIGGGMSSSSALSVIGVLGFSLANGFLENDGGSKSKLSSAETIYQIQNQTEEAGNYLEKIAHIAGEAEWWYGTNGGKMDQFTIALAKSGQAFILDNSNYSYEHRNWFEDIAIVVCDTNVPHDHRRSGYASRREQAERALERIRNFLKDEEIKTYRDLDLETLLKTKNALSDLEYRRASYPVSEMQDRVPKFLLAVENQEVRKAGKILSESYYGLKNNYGVSSLELDLMYNLAIEIDGFAGGSISGGGFGGCLIALVKKSKLENFLGSIENKYNSSQQIKDRKIKGKFTNFISGRGLNVEEI